MKNAENLKMKFVSMAKVLVASAMVVLFVGCSNKEMEDKVARLEKEKTEVQAEADAKQKQVEEVLAAINEIQTGLNAVREKQSIVSKVSSDIESKQKENTQTVKDDILRNITDIDAAMLENKKKMDGLQQKIKGYKTKIAGLEKTMKTLQESVAQKEKEIVTLKEEVTKLNVQVATLTTAVMEKETTIKEQDKSLKTAYYVIDTENSLREKGILEYRGGVIGVGSTKNVTQDFDPTKFKQIDITEMKEIKIDRNISNMEVLTVHSKSAYELAAAGDKQAVLKIKDPQTFWQKSKYLVIMMWN
jgi:chromosome segregation ATPase